MITKIFALFLVLSICYTGAVFIVPEKADLYGIKPWNDKIRAFKSFIDTDNAYFGSGASIAEKVTNIAKPYIEDTQNVTKQVKETIETKSEQAKQAIESVEKVYDAVESAKKDISKFTTFSTGTMTGN